MIQRYNLKEINQQPKKIPPQMSAMKTKAHQLQSQVSILSQIKYLIYMVAICKIIQIYLLDVKNEVPSCISLKRTLILRILIS